MGREALAEAMIPVIGRLYRENNVVTSIHGRSLINKSTMNILKAHRFARRMSKEELRLEETAPLLEALTKLDLGAAAIDIARLTEKYRAEGDGASLDEFLRAELAEVVGKRGGDDRTSTDVVLYGFGRIGRLLARLLIEKAGGGHGLRLRAIVVRKGAENDLTKRASLLRRDSVHGSFNGTITIDEENNTITANGNLIQGTDSALYGTTNLGGASVSAWPRSRRRVFHVSSEPSGTENDVTVICPAPLRPIGTPLPL